MAGAITMATGSATRMGSRWSSMFSCRPRACCGANTRDQARALWRAAMETVNADAPGIFLYALDNVAAVHKRVENVQFRPDSWAALLRTWRIPPDRLIDRDRVER